VTARFELVTVLPVDVTTAFGMSLDVDFHVGSMASSGERAVGAIRGGRLKLGDEVTWQARHFGLWWTMTSRITESDPPRRFVDEQVKGPFRAFRHEHGFEASASGCTMTDRVSFTAPGGPVGRVVERVFLGRYLKRLIEARNAHF
jgi:ligand-binding SRPBCC domain-containing protein